MAESELCIKQFFNHFRTGTRKIFILYYHLCKNKEFQRNQWNTFVSEAINII